MKKLKKRIKATVEKTDTGFSAYANEYSVYTTGQTITELLHNLVEALSLHFEDDNVIISSDNIKFEIDLQQFFQYYRVINAKFLARRIGMNETLLSQYVQGRKKPSVKQTEKILEGIHQIGQELTDISLIAR